jgi:MFS family permease
MGLGLLSATFGVGGGAGLVLSGVILEHLHWSWLFWIGLAPVVGALILVWRLVPESPVRTPSRVDWLGALTLSAGLSALLVALSEGERWGWLSAATLGTGAAAVVVLCLWVLVELRVPEPMVQIGMMRDRAVFWTNAVAVIAGFAMFGTFLLVPTFVQMGAGVPEAIASQIHYGFAASVIVAGLYLLPSSAVMLVVGPAGGILERRVGAKALTAVGFVVLALGALTLAVAHSSGWQIVVAMLLVGTGVGLVYAMLAKLIVDAVPREVTGVAMGMNTVMRTIGGVIGGQVGAAILSADTIADSSIPAESAFTTAFWISAAMAVLAALLAIFVTSRRIRAAVTAPTPEVV